MTNTSSTANQTQFSDLDDEIIADDWVVPREEISRRRLIKRTPRFNIYKADWFGDVLVYEPNSSSSSTRARMTNARAESPPPSREADQSRSEELRLRLANLSLTISESSIPIKKPQASLADSDQADSAYSSISSTPLFNSKTLKSEFEFPSQSVQFSSYESNDFTNSACDTPAAQGERKPAAAAAARPKLILNRDSYNFNDCLLGQHHRETQQDDNGSRQTHSTWRELNELRLIAHESFMLFMGASVDDSLDAYTTHEQSTSLVMQMNHPKAVSLHNLLRATRSGPVAAGSNQSPIDRFLTSRQYLGDKPSLSVAAKLNICQQIRDAMTYLHDKNIVHGRLTSVNIYIELNQRVKISLIDNDEKPLAAAAPDDTGIEFNAAALAYLSPELIRTLCMVKSGSNSHENNRDGHKAAAHVQIDSSQLTKESDVFSFGTIVYSLFNERLPFDGLPAAEVIYRIGSGQMTAANQSSSRVSIRSNGGKNQALVDGIISACWSTDPNSRPHFKQLIFE